MINLFGLIIYVLAAMEAYYIYWRIKLLVRERKHHSKFIIGLDMAYGKDYSIFTGKYKYDEDINK
jgi:hypothetical protein